MEKRDNDTAFDREEHYRNINNELKEKSNKLIREATKLVNSETLSTTIITARPSQCIPGDTLNDSSPQREIIPNSDEDTYLGAISKLSSPAKTRFLVAKVRALEEDNLKLSTELKAALDELGKQNTRVSDLETERARLQKQVSGNQTHLERLRQSIDEAKARADTLSTDNLALQKAVEAARKASESATSSHKNASLRLNRALDEAERQRGEAEKARSTAQDLSDKARRQVEQLTADNKRLERQKHELINGFKKQMRLIDVLRRQKMLTEASRALKITEEEFIKTLDWQSN